MSETYADYVAWGMIRPHIVRGEEVRAGDIVTFDGSPADPEAAMTIERAMLDRARSRKLQRIWRNLAGDLPFVKLETEEMIATWRRMTRKGQS